MDSIISAIASAFQDLVFVLNKKGEFVEFLLANGTEEPPIPGFLTIHFWASPTFNQG